MPSKPHAGASSSAALVHERRAEKRHFISVGKPVYLSWFQEQSLLGRLVEMSRNGFRMVHQYRRFETGQEVLVSFPWGKVRARVIWNMVTRHQVQTGFFIVEDSGRGRRDSTPTP